MRREGTQRHNQLCLSSQSGEEVVADSEKQGDVRGVGVNVESGVNFIDGYPPDQEGSFLFSREEATSLALVMGGTRQEATLMSIDDLKRGERGSLLR